MGEPVILIHGIFGGYDQASVSLNSLVSDEYYKIAPSRFGYPGTACPANPTPERQADQLIELMDNLNIDQAYFIGTSAGGPATYQVALKYPHRVAGIVLLSAGAPYERKTDAELDKELTGPPSFVINDPVMWTAMEYFGGVLQSMFGGDTLDRNLMATILPVGPRRAGVIADSAITNKDMSLNYDSYPLEEITCPILALAAKDDPMVDYRQVEKLIERTQAEAVIYESGGHLLEGAASSEIITAFMVNNSRR